MKRTMGIMPVLLLLAAVGAAAQEPSQPAAASSPTLSAAAQQPQAPEKPVEEQPPLPRYLELTSRVGTGAQPTEAGIRLLAEKGYRSIINIRTSEEMAKLPYEEKLAAELGMKYFNIPVFGREPKESQALAFLQLMDALKDEKVFVHCAAANRAGAFMMIQRALQDGVDPKTAEQEGEKIGMRSENLRLFAREMIEKHKKQ